jgi:acyl-CoA thioesterase-2
MTDLSADDAHGPGRARATRLLEILELEPVEQNLFLGRNEERGGRRLFGGQVLAQALRAAYATVEGVWLHSLHGYFLRAGDAGRNVLYEVDRIRDGKSFTTRRVVAIQHGEAIFNLEASFQVDERGLEHADAMPNVPPPHELEADAVVIARLAGAGREAVFPDVGATRARPFEMRSVFTLGRPESARDRYWNPVWLRFLVPVDPEDRQLAHCLLAYASDMGLVSTAVLPHRERVDRERLRISSLDHAFWVHRAPRLDDWLLFHRYTSMAEGSRGLTHAGFFTRDGKLVASVTQEGLVRLTG